MPKDDYFVMAYKLLKYLYDCLKSSKKPDPNLITADSRFFPIGKEYFTYLIENLYNDDYIRNIKIARYDDEVLVYITDDIQITPKGIEYLQENNMMKRVSKTIKDIRELIHP